MPHLKSCIVGAVSSQKSEAAGRTSRLQHSKPLHLVTGNMLSNMLFARSDNSKIVQEMNSLQLWLGGAQRQVSTHIRTMQLSFLHMYLTLFKSPTQYYMT